MQYTEELKLASALVFIRPGRKWGGAGGVGAKLITLITAGQDCTVCEVTILVGEDAIRVEGTVYC